MLHQISPRFHFGKATPLELLLREGKEGKGKGGKGKEGKGKEGKERGKKGGRKAEKKGRPTLIILRD